MSSSKERDACKPIQLNPEGFNFAAVLPFGCTPDQIRAVMEEFLDFLSFVNLQLNAKGAQRLETMLMPANFSSVVGEFLASNLPKHCAGLVRNQHHNGHPDLIPAGRFPDDRCQHGADGIEIKASRYPSGWQGHNPEDTWLLVFVFASDRPVDLVNEAPPKPFRFVGVFGAELTKADWSFAGRSGASRRTITASVKKSGYEKMTANWIYRSESAPAARYRKSKRT